MASKDIGGVWQCPGYPSTEIARNADGSFTAGKQKITIVDGYFQIRYPSGVWSGALLVDGRLQWRRKRDGRVSYWERVVPCAWRQRAAVFKREIESQQLDDMEHTGCAYVRGRR